MNFVLESKSFCAEFVIWNCTFLELLLTVIILGERGENLLVRGPGATLNFVFLKIWRTTCIDGRAQRRSMKPSWRCVPTAMTFRTLIHIMIMSLYGRPLQKDNEGKRSKIFLYYRIVLLICVDLRFSVRPNKLIRHELEGEALLKMFEGIIIERRRINSVLKRRAIDEVSKRPSKLICCELNSVALQLFTGIWMNHCKRL